MSTPSTFDASPPADSTVDQRDTGMAVSTSPSITVVAADTSQTLAFSRAWRYTQELAFGVLAVIGCVIVQCLLVAWLLFCIVQTDFVLLQARLLCQVYGGTIEDVPSAKAKKAAAKETETVPSGSRPPSSATTTKDLGKQPFVPSQPVELAASVTKQPEEGKVLETTDWKTITLTSRKTGHGRSHKIKQVDVPVSLDLAPHPSGHERSHAVRQNKIAVPSGLGPQVPEIARPHVVGRIAPRIPPGFGPQRPPTETVAQQNPHQPPASAHHDGGQIGSVSSYPDNESETSKATDQLFSPTETVVRLPSAAPDTTIGATRYEIAPKSISENIKDRALLQGDEGSAGRKDTRVAKRSAIRKVAEPAPLSDSVSACVTNLGPSSTMKAEMGELVVSAAPEDIAIGAVQSSLGTNKGTHRGIQPATMEELREKFVDTSLLKDTSIEGRPNTPPAVIVSPPASEEAAREALKIASKEREMARVKLNTGYSHERALDFDEKAKAYKERRQDLMAFLPWRELSMEDEQAFPYLPTKDTVAPQVCHNTFDDTV